MKFSDESVAIGDLSTHDVCRGEMDVHDGKRLAPVYIVESKVNWYVEVIELNPETGRRKSRRLPATMRVCKKID